MRGRTIFVLLCAAAACARAPEGPVRLTLMQPSDAAGRTYAAEMMQSIAIETANGVLNGEREYRIQFHFDGAQAGGADSVIASARLDSIRAIMTSPHGRQVVDTRSLNGTSFPLTYVRSGGAPAYPAASPAADFGMFGGPFPVSIMIDLAFPPMPEQSVQVGDSWERVHARNQVDVGATPTAGNITSHYTLAGFERNDGVWLARLDVASNGDLTGGTDSIGKLEATGFILLGVDDGIVREVSLQESVTADAKRQTTNFRITSVVRGG